MADHAKLSPSAAHRWISCPGSIKLGAEFPDESSVFAEEGTAAHEAAEIYASHRFKMISEKERVKKTTKWVEDLDLDFNAEEILGYASQWADYLQDRMREIDGELVFLERRLDSGVPGVWGTSDAVLVSADTVEICDLKYGQGVKVYADGNEQLMLYALGALATYGDIIDDTKWVTMTIWQPRLEHISTSRISVEELREWRDTIAIPQAEKAGAGSDEFNPSESTCRWCPAKGRCPAQVEKMAAIDFADPLALGAADLGELLELANEAAVWAKSVQEAAHKLAIEDQETIPGYKVIQSAGRRSISNHAGALEALLASQVVADADEVSDRKLLPIGALEKKLGKDVFDEILGDFAPKSEGKLSLVPESHPKPAYDPVVSALDDFADFV